MTLVLVGYTQGPIISDVKLECNDLVIVAGTTATEVCESSVNYSGFSFFSKGGNHFYVDKDNFTTNNWSVYYFKELVSSLRAFRNDPTIDLAVFRKMSGASEHAVTIQTYLDLYAGKVKKVNVIKNILVKKSASYSAPLPLP